LDNGRLAKVKLGIGFCCLGEVGRKIVPRLLPALLPVIIAAAALAAGPVYRAELIFHPSARFPRCHSSNIIELPGGGLMAAWWNGSEEAGRDVVIRSSRLPAGGDRWEPPVVLADTPDTTDANPVLFVSPRGELWLFYRVGYPWVRIMWMKSRDRGLTWSKPAVFLDEPGWTIRNRILLLSSGRILIPAMTTRAAAFIYSSDGGVTWNRSPEVRSDPRNNEPAVFQRSDGSLLAFMRPYDPRPTDRFLWWSESRDEGETWSVAGRTRIRNPSAAIEVLKLRNGHVVLAFNDSQDKRSPLCLALSVDDGRSWSYKRVLEDAPGRFSYPSLVQSRDGNIHLSYTFRRVSIKHVVVNEEWIKESPWQGATF